MNHDSITCVFGVVYGQTIGKKRAHNASHRSWRLTVGQSHECPAHTLVQASEHFGFGEPGWWDALHKLHARAVDAMPLVGWSHALALKNCDSRVRDRVSEQAVPVRRARRCNLPWPR